MRHKFKKKKLTLIQEKLEIRKKLIEKRKNLSEITKSQWSEKILDKLRKEKDFLKAKNILFYLPIKGEVNLTKLTDYIKKDQKIYLPAIKNDEIVIKEFKSSSNLKEGKYLCLEPKHEKISKEEILDLALIPGIAFDKKGNRIGFGKGYYDKLLKKINCLKIGIAYQFQILKKIPTEKHDQKVNKIITEQKIISTN